MHRRTRLRLLPVALVATAVVLAGCGSSNSSSPSSDASLGLDSVKISGDVGADPTVAFSGQVTDPTTTTKVLIQGDGPTVEKDDAVFIQTVIADGYTQKTVASSYHDKQPQVVTLSSKVSPIFLDALAGKKVGSRIVVYTSADNVFGPQGNTSLGISNKDVVLIIFDLVKKPLDKPDGTTKPAPAWAPKLEKTKGVDLRARLRRHPEARRHAEGRGGQGRHRRRGQEGPDDRRALPRPALSGLHRRVRR